MSLNPVQEIEHAIRALTPSELEEFYARLDQHCPQPIDAQLKLRITERTSPQAHLHLARRYVPVFPSPGSRQSR
jgi:hypothetical protein